MGKNAKVNWAIIAFLAVFAVAVVWFVPTPASSYISDKVSGFRDFGSSVSSNVK